MRIYAINLRICGTKVEKCLIHIDTCQARHASENACKAFISHVNYASAVWNTYKKNAAKNDNAIPPPEAHALHGEAMPEDWVEAVGAGMDTMVASCVYKGTSRQPGCPSMLGSTVRKTG